MASVALTGEDTITLYDRVLADFGDGDIGSFTFDDDVVSSTTGKNRNTVFARNEAGFTTTVTLRILRGTADDRFLNERLAAIRGDFATVELAEGQLVKRIGDGAGNVIRDVYTLRGGMFTRNVDTTTNANGDTEQGFVVYTFRFTDTSRGIQ